MRAINRRKALAQIVAAAATPAVLPEFSFAADWPNRHLVVVLLAGGLDGLAAVPAYGDPDYRRMRGGLALPADAILPLDGRLGLHPALAPLHGLYRKGEALVIPAVAARSRAHSHAEAQHHQSAILARLIASGGRGGTFQSCDSASTPGDVLAELWQGAMPGSFRSRCLVESGFSEPNAQQRHRARAFKEAARQLGIQLASTAGARIAVLRCHGWDTHSHQGTLQGRLATALGDLAGGLQTLVDSSGSAWGRTVVIVTTEFGRSVAMNAMGGTDHGMASPVFVLGGAVAGGRVVGSWPGLGTSDLDQGRNLRPTVDLEAVIDSVSRQHIGTDAAVASREVLPDGRAIGALGKLVRAA